MLEFNLDGPNKTYINILLRSGDISVIADQNKIFVKVYDSFIFNCLCVIGKGRLFIVWWEVGGERGNNQFSICKDLCFSSSS